MAIRAFSLLAATMIAAMPVLPARAADSIAGRWVTEGGKGLVEIAACGGTQCGKVRRVGDPKAPHTDINNPDPALRKRPLLGLQVLHGFTDAGDAWKGQIYDPESGKTYRSVVRLNRDGTLEVKGCILFLCRGQTWTRAH